MSDTPEATERLDHRLSPSFNLPGSSFPGAGTVGFAVRDAAQQIRPALQPAIYDGIHTIQIIRPDFQNHNGKGTRLYNFLFLAPCDMRNDPHVHMTTCPLEACERCISICLFFCEVDMLSSHLTTKTRRTLIYQRLFSFSNGQISDRLST